MEYIKIGFANIDDASADILIARLSEASFEGFDQEDGSLNAYISKDDFNEQVLKEIAEELNTHFTIEVIPQQNWNTQWEENFQPVIVDDFCTIRADFHTIEVTTPYEIIITPKMSFGTGHHATTQLMLQAMKELDFGDKTVLDFGSGTGILSIMAEKLGAASIIAIDNDEWCFENAGENIARNECNNITTLLGSLEQLEDKQFDIIVANINRHILLQYMSRLYKQLKNNGILLMSGLLKEDSTIIRSAVAASGLTFVSENEQGGWIAIETRRD